MWDGIILFEDRLVSKNVYHKLRMTTKMKTKRYEEYINNVNKMNSSKYNEDFYQ